MNLGFITKQFSIVKFTIFTFACWIFNKRNDFLIHRWESRFNKILHHKNYYFLWDTKKYNILVPRYGGSVIVEWLVGHLLMNV